MRFKTVLFLLFLLSTSLYSQKLRSEVIVKTDIFTLSYNEIYKQPNWLEYTIKNTIKKVNRGHLDFYTCDSIKTSDKHDYENNIYDKGHLAPAATFSDCYEHLYSTFSYLNCSLQNYKLNRGQWKQLESYERDVLYRKYGTIKVKIVLLFSDNSIVFKDGAHVPDGFTKIIKLTTNDSLIYYFPNKELNGDFQKYKKN